MANVKKPKTRYQSQQKTFGVLGVGRYGAQILAKLQTLGTVIWSIKSESDYTEQEIPDWVFIATPNFLHYEQAEYFLNSGANVFLEKPATLNPKSLKELIKLSKIKGKLFYVDDVFIYRSDININSSTLFLENSQFCWHKRSKSQSGSLLDRLAYHHLYLIYEAFGGKLDFKIESIDSALPTHIEFIAKINNHKCKFSYIASENLDYKHVICDKKIDQVSNDAILDMLDAVLSKRISFESNHKRALWVTSTIVNIKKSIYQNIVIVGGGIFGSTIAIQLAGQGYNVVMFERHDRLLSEASSINQYRVHEGYHYPRSEETARECKESASIFAKIYRQAIIKRKVGIKHYYAIASKESKTNPEQFVDFMNFHGLYYRKVKPIDGVDLMVKVKENLFDPNKLNTIVNTRLRAVGVEIRLGQEASQSDLEGADFAVIATYANLNDWCLEKRMYQFELCEKPVLKLPVKYRKKSIVIMDGPFMCIDPLGDSGLHVMGNVVHAIHHTNIGYKPIIPLEYQALLNKGIINNPSITHISNFLKSAQAFFPDIENAEHIGSMYTIRTVLPHREADDARPTLVEWIDDKSIVVFSGKVCTSINAAKNVLIFIEKRIAENHDKK